MKNLTIITAVTLSAAILAGCATQSEKSCTPPPAPAKPTPAPVKASPPPKPAAKVEQPKPAVGKPAPAKPAVKPVAPPKEVVSEFDQMATLVNLQGEQLVTFNQKRAAREQALAAWNSSASGKKLAESRLQQAAAKEAGNTNQVQQLQKQAILLTDEEWVMKKKLRAEVISVLTLPQQQKWAGFVLFGKVEKTFRKAKLTEQQVAQAKAVCDKQASNFVKDGTIAADPYLTTLAEIQPATVKAITDSVLTAEQKTAMQPAPATAPAKK
jgi:hypothetical protein